MECDVLIIGGGLSGLMLAQILDQQDCSVVLLEARTRLGGRILTRRNKDEVPVEMGATWLGKKHESLLKTLEKFGVQIFEQYLGELAIYEPISTSPPQLVRLPLNSEPSYRIKNGTDSIIKTLEQSLQNVQVILGEPVDSIVRKDHQLNVRTVKDSYQCKVCVSTLPPYLFEKKVTVQPSLPESVKAIMKTTHTWMGESIKVSLIYSSPFWLAKNTSGTIASNVGPIPEMYDQSDKAKNHYALTGFFNGVYFSLSKEERLEMVLAQLEKYYGGIVREYSDYAEKVWRKEEYTFSAYDSHILPHENNGNAIYQSSFLEGQLILAGSETALNYPGYMDGAIGSAERAFKQVMSKLNNKSQV